MNRYFGGILGILPKTKAENRETFFFRDHNFFMMFPVRSACAQFTPVDKKMRSTEFRQAQLPRSRGSTEHRRTSEVRTVIGN